MTSKELSARKFEELVADALEHLYWAETSVRVGLVEVFLFMPRAGNRDVSH
jgi:hypothetical protein